MTARSAWPDSATGARTSPATSTSSPSCAGSATRRPSCSRRRRERYPDARATGRFEELLEDPDARRRRDRDPGADPLRRWPSRRSRRASTSSSRSRWRWTRPTIEELVALADERDLVLMPGHLLLYHPGVREAEGAVDSGELGDVLYLYGNRQNLGKIRRERERALVARRPRPLGDPLPARRGAERGWAHGSRLPHRRRRGRRLLLPALPLREGRAHAPLLARPAQDAPDDRRRAREDGRLRRHGARAQGHRLRQGARAADRDLRRVADAHRRQLLPKIPNDEPLRLECQHFLGSLRGRGRPHAVAQRRARCRRARSSSCSSRSSRCRNERRDCEIADSAIVYPGTVLGEGCKILDNAVVGKQPSLWPRSTAKREPLPPASHRRRSDHLDRRDRLRRRARSASA